MTWNKAFALAACGVDVSYAGAGGNTGWSGVLGLGQSSPEFLSFYGDSNLVVSIDSAGVVSLNAVSGTLTDAAGIIVKVTRGDLITAAGIRAAGITINGAVAGGTVATSVKFSSGETLALTGDASAWTPDPAEVASDAGNLTVTAGYLT